MIAGLCIWGVRVSPANKVRLSKLGLKNRCKSKDFNR